jgi:hypothetical protein
MFRNARLDPFITAMTQWEIIKNQPRLFGPILPILISNVQRPMTRPIWILGQSGYHGRQHFQVADSQSIGSLYKMRYETSSTQSSLPNAAIRTNVEMT